MAGDGDGYRDPTRPAQTAPHRGTVVDDLCAAHRPATCSATRWTCAPSAWSWGTLNRTATCRLPMCRTRSACAPYGPSTKPASASCSAWWGETVTDSLAHLTSEQRTILGVAEAMLRSAGIAPRLGCGDPGRSLVGVGRPAEVIHLRRHRRAAARSPAALGAV